MCIAVTGCYTATAVHRCGLYLVLVFHVSIGALTASAPFGLLHLTPPCGPQNDKLRMKNLQRYLEFLLEPLVGGQGAEADNLSLLLQMLDTITTSYEDALEPSNNRIHITARVARQVLLFFFFLLACCSTCFIIIYFFIAILEL